MLRFVVNISIYSNNLTCILPNKYILYHMPSMASVQMLLCEANIYIYSTSSTCMLPLSYSLSFIHELFPIKHISQSRFCVIFCPFVVLRNQTLMVLVYLEIRWTIIIQTSNLASYVITNHLLQYRILHCIFIYSVSLFAIGIIAVS